MTPPPCDLLVILGPTASGKTRLGVTLANRFNGAILSADSRQVYRGLDIGTGKDLEEYGPIPYHLINVVDPGYPFSLFDFQQRFLACLQTVRQKGQLPLLVGGTGLYLESALKGYRLLPVPESPTLRQTLAPFSWPALEARLRHIRPDQHNTTDLESRDRLVRAIEIAEAQHAPASAEKPWPVRHPLILGIRWPRAILRQRITERLQQRLEQGLLMEVSRLLASGVSYETLYSYGLEYRFAVRHLRGELNENAFFQKLNTAIHQFAKRQETWFRRMERNGITIHWIAGGDTMEAESLALLERATPPP